MKLIEIFDNATDRSNPNSHYNLTFLIVVAFGACFVLGALATRFLP